MREEAWHPLVRQVSAAKRRWFPGRGEGNPHEWEAKSADFLLPNAWNRAKNRKFCFELAAILQQNRCYVYSISMEKAKAKDPLVEEKFVSLMLERLVGKFYDQVVSDRETGSVVMDWSTHQMDHHITRCISAMTAVKAMDALRGGVSYGSSAALPPLQVADIIASTIRRDAEGQPHVVDLAGEFRKLQYVRDGVVDDFKNPMCSIGKIC